MNTELLISGCDVNVSNLTNKTPAHLTPFFFEKLPINSASEEALKSVSGIGSYLARNIIEYRKKFGSIDSAAELQKVRGIGPNRSRHLSNYLSYCE